MKTRNIADLKVGERVFDSEYANKQEMVVVRVTETNVYFKPVHQDVYKQKGYTKNEYGEIMFSIFSQEPWHQLELADLTLGYADKFGRLYIPSIDGSDCDTEITTDKQLKDFAMRFIVKWGPTVVYFNPNGVWSERIEIVNEQFQARRNKFYEAKKSWYKDNTSN